MADPPRFLGAACPTIRKGKHVSSPGGKRNASPQKISPLLSTLVRWLVQYQAADSPPEELQRWMGRYDGELQRWEEEGVELQHSRLRQIAKKDDDGARERNKGRWQAEKSVQREERRVSEKARK